jgi:hypothetical protein
MTDVTEDGKTYMVVTTDEGISYKIPAENRFIAWVVQPPAGSYTLQELVAAPPGRTLDVLGIVMQSGSGNIYVYNYTPGGTPTLVADSTVSTVYTWPRTSPLEVLEGCSLRFSATLTASPLILAFGLIA